MKIVIGTKYWNSPIAGGIGTYLSGYYKALKKHAPDDRYIIIFTNGDDDEQVKIPDGRIRSMLYMARRLKTIKPDVIHIHEDRFLLFASAFYKHSHKKCNLIFTFHSEPAKDNPLYKKLYLAILKVPLKWSLQKCNNVTFVAKNLRESVRSRLHLGISKSTITYGSALNKPFKESDCIDFMKEHHIAPDKTILLMQAFTATSVKAEGIKLVIRTLKSIQNEYPDLLLLLTRNGKFIPELKEYIAVQNLRIPVVFTGDVKNPFIPLSISTINLHISFADGMPIALLEAMSLGKPTIASRVGGIPEAITHGETGILIENTESALKNAIIQMIGDKALQHKLGENAKRTFQSQFSWDENIKNITYLYNPRNN